MKEAKIILTAIAVLAVVGGALAFKVKRTVFHAYVPTGITTTFHVVGPFIYTTTVPACIIDPILFIGNGIQGNTYMTTYTFITGFSGGVARTWREVICTPTITLVTEIE